MDSKAELESALEKLRLAYEKGHYSKEEYEKRRRMMISAEENKNKDVQLGPAAQKVRF